MPKKSSAKTSAKKSVPAKKAANKGSSAKKSVAGKTVGQIEIQASANPKHSGGTSDPGYRMPKDIKK